MKKFISLILCAVLLLSMGGAAYAEVPQTRYAKLSDLIEKYSGIGSGDTDSVSSATKKPDYNNEEHVSLGIKIPALDSFLGRKLDVYLYDVLKNYVHICYDSYIGESELDEYMELLEDDYDFELAIYDWSRGIYAYDYFEEPIWTLYPGYGYKDEDDVAFMIVHDDDFTHVYYSIDFDYCSMEECQEDDDPLSLENWEKFKEQAGMKDDEKREIRLPDMEGFFGLLIKDSDEEDADGYRHFCYEMDFNAEYMEEYVQLLEEDYGLWRIYPEDAELDEGFYCMKYVGLGDVDYFRPEHYGYLDLDMAVFIACYPKYTHIYFAEQFDYE